MDLEIINKLYLELSQVATATTFKELQDREQIEKMVHLLYIGINAAPDAIPAWKKAVKKECQLIKVEDTTGKTDSVLGFHDAVRIARGCLDFGGGYDKDQQEVYHHGIRTVIRCLEAAETDGLKDTQILALWKMGRK